MDNLLLTSQHNIEDDVPWQESGVALTSISDPNQPETVYPVTRPAAMWGMPFRTLGSESDVKASYFYPSHQDFYLQSKIRAIVNDLMVPQTSVLFSKFFDLETKVSELQQNLNEQKIVNERICVIKYLRSKKLSLKEPLYLNIKYNKDDELFIVDSADLNIWGYGVTEDLALQNFSEDLEDFYFDLKKNKKILSNDSANKWEFLKSILKEKK